MLCNLNLEQIYYIYSGVRIVMAHVYLWNRPQNYEKYDEG
jgi:hypothetical protein